MLEEEKENIISRMKLIRSLILLRSFKRIKREITRRNISTLINVTIVIRSETLLEIFQQEKKNIRGRISKDIMLMQSKKKNLPCNQQRKKLKNIFSSVPRGRVP